MMVELLLGQGYQCLGNLNNWGDKIERAQNHILQTGEKRKRISTVGTLETTNPQTKKMRFEMLLDQAGTSGTWEQDTEINFNLEMVNEKIFNGEAPSIQFTKKRIYSLANKWYKENYGIKQPYQTNNQEPNNSKNPTALNRNLNYNNNIFLYDNTCKGQCQKQNSIIHLGISEETEPRWIIQIQRIGSKQIIKGDSPIYEIDSYNRGKPVAKRERNSANRSLLEALIVILYLSENHKYHLTYIVTDVFFSEVWDREFSRINKLQDWNSILKDKTTENCGYIWFPTAVSCFTNLQEALMENFKNYRTLNKPSEINPKANNNSLPIYRASVCSVPRTPVSSVFPLKQY
ncbi:hypothetical protein LIER_36356 [Lithospermum erythrorhizon]|uniref:Uncharacterized protein n=1 Tax=Lithospermum erythrorhizon TaxID=34254 RepID=A0AAV3P7G1_LITER